MSQISLRDCLIKARSCRRSWMASRVYRPCLSAFLLPRGAPDPGAPPCMRQRFFRSPPGICRACRIAFWPRSAGSKASEQYYVDGCPLPSFRLRRTAAGARSGSSIIAMAV